MYQVPLITACFKDLIGFNQPDDPTYPTIDTDLLVSTSGKYLKQVHELCTLENIINAGPEFHNFVYPDWVTGTKYNAGTRATYTGKIYKAKVLLPNSVVAPHSDAANWTEIDPLSEYLREKYTSACVNLVLQYINQRKLSEKGKSLLELSEVYKGFGSLSNPIIGQGRFVGWEITSRSAWGVLARLDKIGMQAMEAQDELIIYLYHSGFTEPIFEIPISIESAKSFNWTSLSNKLIGYMQNDVSSQGVYYLGYYEDDLAGQAIKKDLNLYRGCITCDRYNYDAWKNWSQYIDIRAISVPANALEVDKTLFDTSAVTYVYDNTWGLNMSFAIICDYTAVFCANKSVFADALAMQLALEFINTIAFTSNINVIADQQKKLAMAELSTDPKSGSFMLQYLNMLAGLDVDMSGLNRVCLPCDKAGKIKYGAI